MHRDPDDPASFNASALEDEGIHASCRKVKLRAFAQKGHSNKSASVRVRLKDGREFEKYGESFKGMPSDPYTRAELRRKFMLLFASSGRETAERLYEHLANLERQPQLDLS
jgi:hypothetical protein